METGKPITVFLLTALVLWAIYLWRHGRLGQTQMLPHPADAAPASPPAPAAMPPIQGDFRVPPILAWPYPVGKPNVLGGN